MRGTEAEQESAARKLQGGARQRRWQSRSAACNSTERSETGKLREGRINAPAFADSFLAEAVTKRMVDSF